ncbi:MAG TPA: MotA/TolQ/ExbB proton channel family protein [Spirochaetota bacterium]|nr:MotA/TolQ/ExbB proton channel family protein [Spirochaetota bacterium]
MTRTTRTGIAVIVSLALSTAVPAVFAPAGAREKSAPTHETAKSFEKNTSPEADANSVEKVQADNTIVAGDPTEATESTNLFSTVKQGGPLMIFILLLGLVSMTIIIERMIFFTRFNVWKKERLDEMLRAAKESSPAKFREDMEDDLRNRFQVFANGLERGLALLSGMGNLAPIVGFLGTVIGMISAFAAIAAATTVNAKVVAVGIQVALVTTAGGLIVAAPTLFFYYVFTNAIQNLYTRSEEYIASITGGMPRLSDKIINGDHSS